MRNKKGIRHTENKSGRNKYFLISNCFACKQIKLFNKRQLFAEQNFKKGYNYVIYKTHFRYKDTHRFNVEKKRYGMLTITKKTSRSGYCWIRYTLSQKLIQKTENKIIY